MLRFTKQKISKSNKLLFIFIFLFIFYFANLNQVFAGERQRFYTGVRQMGMGGVVVATVDDETALLSNPAALGKLRNTFVTLFDPQIDANADVTRIMTAGNLTGALDAQGLLTALNGNTGRHFHLDGTLFPSLIIPNFGFGLYVNYLYNAEVDSTGTNYTLNYRNDYAPIVGYNFRLLDGIIKIGFHARYMNRVEINKVLPANSLGLTISNLASEGNAIGADAGFIFTLPYTYLPSLAITAHDVGGTNYNLGAGYFYQPATRPQSVPQTYDGGISISPILGNRNRMQISFEYQDFLNAYQETDMWRRLHGGIEFNFSDLIFLRAGWNQRYWTAGLELAIRNFQIQAATYGEDIGVDGVSTKEDRRYIGKFSFRF